MLSPTTSSRKFQLRQRKRQIQSFFYPQAIFQISKPMASSSSYQPARSMSSTSSTWSGTTATNGPYSQACMAYPAPVARTASYSSSRQVMMWPGHGCFDGAEHQYQIGITHDTSSPVPGYGMPERSPLVSISGNTVKQNADTRAYQAPISVQRAKDCQGQNSKRENKKLNFSYRNIYATSTTRRDQVSVVGTAKGRSTIGNGSGVPAGCTLM